MDKVRAAFSRQYPDFGIASFNDLLLLLHQRILPESVLRDLADIAVSVLQEMGSPGCEFLYLCDGDKPIVEVAKPVEHFALPQPMAMPQLV